MLNGAGDEGGEGGNPEGGARSALTGHLIAIETGNDGRSFSGDIQQD